MAAAKRIWVVPAILAAVGVVLWAQKASERARQVSKPNPVATRMVLAASDRELVASKGTSFSDDPYRAVSRPANPPKESQEPILTVQKLDQSVVGRAFPLPIAVETACRTTADPTCEDVRKNLEKMVQEPRDMTWAPAMEALIESDVTSVEPGRFHLRYVECRTSLCAAVVDSSASADGRYGSYMGGIQIGHDALEAALQTNLNTWGYEADSSGVRVTVTAITFTRR